MRKHATLFALILAAACLAQLQVSTNHHSRKLANDDILIYSVPTSFQAHPGRVVRISNDGTFQILRTDYNAQGRIVTLHLGGVTVPLAVRNAAVKFMRKYVLGPRRQLRRWAP